MSGKESIIEKIREDARIKANSTLEEGSKRAQEAINVARNDANIYKEKNMAESYAEREEIISRKITVAHLDVKKTILQAKKEIIDKAFEEAVKLIKSDEKGYLSLIERMLGFAEDGDEIVISEEDKKTVKKKFITDTASGYGKKVSVRSGYGSFCGGIMICGKGSDKNLTLEAELSAIRSEYEPEIAGVLFGE